MSGCSTAENGMRVLFLRELLDFLLLKYTDWRCNTSLKLAAAGEFPAFT